MRRLASGTVYLVKERSGRFNTTLIDERYSYEVHGDEVKASAGHPAATIAVSDLVQQQIGFEVILLDSKCFPIPNAEQDAMPVPTAPKADNDSDSDFELPSVNIP